MITIHDKTTIVICPCPDTYDVSSHDNLYFCIFIEKNDHYLYCLYKCILSIDIKSKIICDNIDKTSSHLFWSVN